MKATCDFCFRRCSAEEGEAGRCGRRINRCGRMTSPFYGMIPAIAIDPVEKKPLYHFLPGTKTLSFGASGCNLTCLFCQNWQLSQGNGKGERIDPGDAAAYASINGIPSISFTYSEPIIWQDWAFETASYARDEGIRTIMVSNGTFTPESLAQALDMIDAFNIDLKGDSGFYSSICGGGFSSVIESISQIAAYGRHIEVTTMAIEGIHTDCMMHSLARILREAGVQVWHITRFFPHYKMNNREPTSERCIARFIDIAKEEGIPYAYPGNSLLSSPTICPSCGHTIRKGPGSTIDGGCCPFCGTPVYGLWTP